MYVFSTFEQSAHLEMAIGALEENGIQKHQILAVPLDKRSEPRRLMDSIHYSDGTSLMDGTALVATFFGAIGTIVGFSLSWGPVIWGMLGFGAGGVLGFSVEYWRHRRKSANLRGMKNLSEVVVTVFCQESQAQMVEDTLWRHNALGVAKLHINPVSGG